jgi:hypothetical protein
MLFLSPNSSLLEIAGIGQEMRYEVFIDTLVNEFEIILGVHLNRGKNSGVGG